MAEHQHTAEVVARAFRRGRFESEAEVQDLWPDREIDFGADLTKASFGGELTSVNPVIHVRLYLKLDASAAQASLLFEVDARDQHDQRISVSTSSYGVALDTEYEDTNDDDLQIFLVNAVEALCILSRPTTTRAARREVLQDVDHVVGRLDTLHTKGLYFEIAISLEHIIKALFETDSESA